MGIKRVIVSNLLYLSKIGNFFNAIDNILDDIFYVHELDRKNKNIPNLTRYGNSTLQRINYLKNIINKRTVAILLKGESLNGLKANIKDHTGKDICYFGVNEYKEIEEQILFPYGKKFSLITFTAINNDTEKIFDDITESMLNDRELIYLTEKRGFKKLKYVNGENFKFDDYNNRFNKQLFFIDFEDIPLTVSNGFFLNYPNYNYPLTFPRQNSLTILIIAAVIGGSPNVVLFGADGGGDYYQGNGKNTNEQLRNDTNVFNITMPLILENIKKVYNIPIPKILNCSSESHINIFQKISYEDFNKIV